MVYFQIVEVPNVTLIRIAVDNVQMSNVQGTAGQTYAVQEWAKVLELQSTNDCANHCTYMGR